MVDNGPTLALKLVGSMSGCRLVFVLQTFWPIEMARAVQKLLLEAKAGLMLARRL